MKTLTFSNRCTKEILRDPLNLGFGLGFPTILLLLLSAMQKNIPVELFNIANLSPGIAVFGLSFITLFSATLALFGKNGNRGAQLSIDFNPSSL